MTSVLKTLQLGQSKFWSDNEILFCKIRHLDTNRYLNTFTLEKYLYAVNTLFEEKKVPFLIDLKNAEKSFSIKANITLARSHEFYDLQLAKPMC